MYYSLDQYKRDHDMLTIGALEKIPEGTLVDETQIEEYKNIHKPNAPKGIKISLNPGDMLIYSGCELEHWREPFQGNLCGQVFLHYNHANGPYAKTNLYDKRPMLGIVKNG